MNILVEGVALIEHAQARKVFEIYPDDLKFKQYKSEDQQNLNERRYVALVEHDELDEVAFHVWEYPEGTIDHSYIDAGPHNVIMGFGYSVEPEKEDASSNSDSEMGVSFSDGSRFSDGSGFATISSEEEDQLVTDTGTGLEVYEELTAEEQEGAVDLMVEWFFKHFEDPANSLPYNSREGGYQWIWGGPASARDEIENHFHTEFSSELMERAVAEIEENGLLEWTPIPDDSDLDAETPIDDEIGTSQELEMRDQMLLELDAIAASLPKLERPELKFGGNNPPPEARFWEEDFNEIEEQISQIKVSEQSLRSELSTAEPDVDKVRDELNRFEQVREYISQKLDKGVDAFVTSFGKTAGVALCISLTYFLGTFAGHLNSLQVQFGNWLQALGLG